jgi:hypothetical protein
VENPHFSILNSYYKLINKTNFPIKAAQQVRVLRLLLNSVALSFLLFIRILRLGWKEIMPRAFGPGTGLKEEG